MRRSRRFVLALVAVFVVSRVLYWWAGVRFDPWAITNSWQLLPQDLLKHDLVRSLWYQHSQPPLFNLVVGVTLHFPHAIGLLNIEFLACSIALTILMFFTMLELRVPAAFAFAVAALFAISPTTVLYENWMYYTYPVALMSVAAVWCFARYLRTKHVGYAIGVSAMLAGLALTRSSYHLVFVAAGATVVVLATRKPARRRVAVVVAIPVILVAGVYVKNFVVFGQPTSSSWLGLNLAHMVLGNQPEAVKADVDKGVLSRQALIAPFIDLGGYSAHHAPTGVPALDRPLKEPGVNNYNNIAYIDISQQYLDDSLTFIRRHPDLYARTAGDSFRTMFVPAADFVGVQYEKRNYPKVERLVEIENRLLGQYRDYRQPTRGLATTGAPDWQQIAWGLVAFYGTTLLAAAAVAVRSIRRRRWSAPGASMVFLGCIVAYAVLSSNLFELGENMRFRLECDPLVYIGTAAVAAAIVTRVRAALASRVDARDSQLLLLAEAELVLDDVTADSGRVHSAE